MLYIPQQLIYFHSDYWWGLSSYLDTELETVPEVMEPMVLIPGSQHLVNMVDEQGNYFWPEPIPPQSTLGDWMPIGYKLKVKNTPACLPIYGDSLVDQSFFIDGSFTYLPVLTNIPTDIETLFADRVDDILLIYDWADNQIWTPLASDFDELLPGYAYLLINKFGFDNYNIEFPDFDPEAPLLLQAHQSGSNDKFHPPWKITRESTSFRFYLFGDKATGNLKPGDIIGAFNENGECCGLTQYGTNDDVFKLVVSVGDKFTNFSNRINNYEPINFRVHRPSSGEEFEISFDFDEDFANSVGRHNANMVSMVKDIINLNSSLPASMQRVSIYPNPTTGTVHISGIQGDFTVEIYNAVREKIHQADLSGEAQINLFRYPKGIYMLKITTEDFSFTEKVVLN